MMVSPVAQYHKERRDYRNRLKTELPNETELNVKTCTLYGYSKGRLLKFDITFAIGNRENPLSYFYIENNGARSGASCIKRILFSDDGRLRHKFLEPVKGNYTAGVALTKYAIDALVFDGQEMTPENYWYDRELHKFVGRYQYSYKMKS